VSVVVIELRMLCETVVSGIISESLACPCCGWLSTSLSYVLCPGYQCFVSCSICVRMTPFSCGVC
jgi:hypothetical protein